MPLETVRLEDYLSTADESAGRKAELTALWTQMPDGIKRRCFLQETQDWVTFAILFSYQWDVVSKTWDDSVVIPERIELQHGGRQTAMELYTMFVKKESF